MTSRDRLGVDVGGTFTDFLYIGENGSARIGKVFSTPSRPEEGVISGIADLRVGAGTGSFHFSQSSTIATNALLEGRGARVGLIATEGFEHVLHIARGRTPGPLSGWITFLKPDSVVDLVDTRGIPERITAGGEIRAPLDVDALLEAARSLVEAGVESIAIAFLHAYANPTHERAAKEALLQAGIAVPIVASSDTMPQFREYERTQTTAVNARLIPIVRDYVAGLDERTRPLGSLGLSVLRSDGGRMPGEMAAELPVMTVLSGPAAGVIGAGAIATSLGLSDFVTFDMGGTSTDVSVSIGGAPGIRREIELGSVQLAVPVVDIVAVGAGGGSLAHVPEITGALRVGPESAGARPGPACYGQGGTKPTVTDADLLLGFLPQEILGGELSLDAAAARAAVGQIARALEMSLAEAAEGIYRIVNENMLGALRVVSSQRGHDPRSMALIAFGGAGPMHAVAMAEILGTWPVVVPPHPGVLSALGAALAEYRSEFSQAVVRRLDVLEAHELAAVLEDLGGRALEWLREVALPEKGALLTEMDVRYYRQGFELTVKLGAGELAEIASGDFGSIERTFEQEHLRLYGFVLQTPIELVNVRVIALAGSISSGLPTVANAVARGKRVVGEQPMYCDDEWFTAAVYDRRGLSPGDEPILGPAIVVEPTSTTVVLPGYSLVVHETGSLLIRPQEGRE